MKKLLFIFGTRPEAIKLASLIIYLKKNSQYDIEVCVTAQHREMLDQVLSLFDIVPDYDLDLMQKDQDLYDITANSLKGIRKVIQESKPTHIIVHGDTTTTLTGALAGFYSNIEVCHVEAGLRTYDLKKPFPEEANRQIVSKLTTHHFCPTIESKSNLIKEGIDENKILITGNTVIDTLRLAQDIINNDTNTRNKIQKSLENKIYKEFYKDKYILITGHRRESFGRGFTNICESISKLAEENSNINFIYPVHLNPNVSTPVNEILSKYENVFLIDPLDYIDFVFLLMGSFFVLTDSGGIQEEAPSLGKPVLVMRDKTERPEAVNAGTVKLVGSSFNKIYEGATQLIKDKNSYKKMARSINPYGDGEAAARIRDYFETI
tara:strand:+ start:253 stop:1386 length:1134 start_codon:yes stop_codon:yes gene_type:complete